MYTTKFLSRTLAFYSPEGPRGGEAPTGTFEADREVRKGADSRKILEGMARSKDAQAQGAQQMSIDRFDASKFLDDQLDSLLGVSLPNRPSVGGNRGGENTDILAGYPEVRNKRESGGVIVFESGDTTVLVAGGKKQEFPTRLFNDSFIRQFAQMNGVNTSEVVQTPIAQRRGEGKPDRVVRSGKIDRPRRDAEMQGVREAKGGDIPEPSTSEKLEDARRELAKRLEQKARGGNSSTYDQYISEARTIVASLETKLKDEQRMATERARLATLEKDKGDLRGLLEQRHALRVEQTMSFNPREVTSLGYRIQTLDQQITRFIGAKRISPDTVASLEPKFDQASLIASKAQVQKLRTELTRYEEELKSIRLSGSRLPERVAELNTRVNGLRSQIGDTTNTVYARNGVTPVGKSA